MAKNSPEGSHINYPWDEKQGVSLTIRCPNCGNDGMDGSITGFSNQWGITRKCLKCQQQWCGGIGVQQADFSQDPPIPGVTRPEPPPKAQNLGGGFRDPSKNHDPEEP